MTCNDFDCVRQHFAAIEAGTLIKIALWVPMAFYGFCLWDRWYCGRVERERRYKIGLDRRPKNHQLQDAFGLFKIALICLIPLTILMKIVDIVLPDEFSRLQPLKWIL